MRCSCISSTIWSTHEDVTYQTQHLLETSTASKIHSLGDFQKRPDGQWASGGDQGQSRATGKEQKGSNSIILGGTLPQQFLERSMKNSPFSSKIHQHYMLVLEWPSRASLEAERQWRRSTSNESNRSVSRELADPPSALSWKNHELFPN